MGTEASGGSTSLDLSIRDDDLILCRSYGARGSHKEIGFGYHPLDSPFPLLLAQLSLPSALSLCMQIILSPLGQSSFFAQMLVSFYCSVLFVLRLYSNRSEFKLICAWVRLIYRNLRTLLNI